MRAGCSPGACAAVDVWGTVLAVALFFPWAPPARAAEPDVVRIVGDSQGCPAPASVSDRLRALLPGVRIAIGAVPGGGHTVLLWDDGRRYSISVRGAERLIDGERQSCAERARAAAVVITLALFPAGGEAGARAPPSIAARTHKRSPAALRVSLGVGALFDVAPGASGGSAAAAGLGVRAFVGRANVGVTLGVGAVAWSTSTFESFSVRARRFPFDVGVRGVWPLGPVEIAGDVGLSLGLLSLAGPGLDARTDAARFEWGPRFAALVRPAWSRRWAPFLSFETVVVPRPFELAVDGSGVIGTTPRARVGVLAGVEVRLF